MGTAKWAAPFGCRSEHWLGVNGKQGLTGLLPPSALQGKAANGFSLQELLLTGMGQGTSWRKTELRLHLGPQAVSLWQWGHLPRHHREETARSFQPSEGLSLLRAAFPPPQTPTTSFQTHFQVNVALPDICARPTILTLR